MGRLLLPTEPDLDRHDHGHADSPPQGVRWSRRQLVHGAALAALLPWATHAGAQAPLARPTSEDALGPFYPTTLEPDSDADLTSAPGRSGRAAGTLLYVSGRVLDRRGAPLAGVQIDIWQANAVGRYAHPGDDSDAPLDPAFLGFARLKTDAEGRYALKTIKPGEYGRRTPHIHFELRAARSRLVTQMYFEGERRNESDGLLNAGSAAGRATKMSRWAAPTGTQEKDALVAQWDVVLAFG